MAPLPDAPAGVTPEDETTTLEPKPSSASRTTLSHIVSPQDANLYGTGHGGVVMKLVDDAAAAVAGRHSGGPAVTAAVDELTFLVPARVGDLLHAHAQVNWTGRTSMEIGVRVLAERWNESTPAHHVASAYLTFVAIDPEGRPRPVPPVRPETAEDHRRFREAEIRRTHRLARRRAIQLSRADHEAAEAAG
ncbi:Acyl-CoA hydrolase [Streptoalloteichus tenebrarius]|uniref:Acyl-CoA hydrolase n=1 Tax=Streptoalloteichus tenebrarius (strain ATCC 17920 / DSM 40477 / JCM 4838 / CBS 697.72 / NBRC 16177 / NCIMB 11028 / NRRL B-12390 / A12253. 1 / ISP 5477) TaxID=1933 RepID=A0ABT1HS80_STRSD|nr:acyl-CoA thioesterase [Streptoalloteichus tenebrarius]MCP2258352.1 Acyl-CoA hydrolase [Streptoalloteichus tenebrarius]BFF03519.1 acyl-CoA thioesterase [Streptoalloteichus tenebrarius]